MGGGSKREEPGEGCWLHCGQVAGCPRRPRAPHRQLAAVEHADEGVGARHGQHVRVDLAGRNTGRIESFTTKNQDA